MGEGLPCAVGLRGWWFSYVAFVQCLSLKHLQQIVSLILILVFDLCLANYTSLGKGAVGSAGAKWG